MGTLYMAVTGGDDWSNAYFFIADTGTIYLALFIFYTFFFTFAIFNILTGIFVEKAVLSMDPDREERIVEQRRRFLEDASEFRNICQEMDLDHSGEIQFKEFEACMKNTNMVAYMASVGLSIDDIEHFFVIVAGGIDKPIEIEHFVHGCMNMKGQATALDLRKEYWLLQKVERRLCQFEVFCNGQLKHVCSLCETMASGKLAAADALVAPFSEEL